MRGLLAEVGRSVLLFGANLGFGLDAQIVIERVAVAGICGQPKGSLESLAIVAQRHLHAVDSRTAMRAMRVVERGAADPNLHVGNARAA